MVVLLQETIDTFLNNGWKARSGDFEKLMVMKKEEEIEIGLNSIDNPTYVYVRYKK